MVLGLIHPHVNSETLREAILYEKLAKDYPEKMNKREARIALRNQFLQNQITRNLIYEHDRITGDLLDKRIPTLRRAALEHHLHKIKKRLEEEEGERKKK